MRHNFLTNLISKYISGKIKNFRVWLSEDFLRKRKKTRQGGFSIIKPHVCHRFTIFSITFILKGPVYRKTILIPHILSQKVYTNNVILLVKEVDTEKFKK